MMSTVAYKPLLEIHFHGGSIRPTLKIYYLFSGTLSLKEQPLKIRFSRTVYITISKNRSPGCGFVKFTISKKEMDFQEYK